jgi:hypothetical protein
MKISSIAIIISFFLIAFLFLYKEDMTEGFALPATQVNIKGFRIYASMESIAAKLPFVHTSFSQITVVGGGESPWDPGSLTTDSTPRLYEFKLKTPQLLRLTENMMTNIQAASTQLFFRPDAIGYLASDGTVYPTTSTALTAPPPPTSIDSSGNSIDSSGNSV